MIKDKFGLPVFRLKCDELSKYEIVLLLARRAKAINQKRVELEAQLGTKILETEKPINQATRELLEGKLKYEFRKEEKEAPPAPPKPTKTII